MWEYSATKLLLKFLYFWIDPILKLLIVQSVENKLTLLKRSFWFRFSFFFGWLMSLSLNLISQVLWQDTLIDCLGQCDHMSTINICGHEAVLMLWLRTLSTQKYAWAKLPLEVWKWSVQFDPIKVLHTYLIYIILPFLLWWAEFCNLQDFCLVSMGMMMLTFDVNDRFWRLRAVDIWNLKIFDSFLSREWSDLGGEQYCP